jgi:hypothetical protein
MIERKLFSILPGDNHRISAEMQIGLSSRPLPILGFLFKNYCRNNVSSISIK